MILSRIRFERFTAFDDLDVALSPGVNVLIGANATGKTHLMKVAYAACDITKTQIDFAGGIGHLHQVGLSRRVCPDQHVDARRQGNV